MLRDIRQALRLLGRNPLFALIAIGAIALGIGANTALFSVVDAVILKPLPFAEPERLVLVWETRPDRGKFNNVVSNANFVDWRERNQVFDAMSPVFFRTGTLVGVGDPEEVRTQVVGEEFFPMLGVKMAMGRGFTAEECRPGGPAAAVLSDSLWRTKFSGDSGMIGRTVRLGSEAVTVVGVAPPGLMSIGERAPALWTNARVAATNPDGRRSAGRNMAVLARLKPGVTVEAADRHMVGLARQLEQEYPQFNSNWSARVSPLTEEMTGNARRPLFVLLGAVACVLLIACANVANLLLARATGRARELALRMSLGATRGRLIRQLLAESMTLTVLGAMAGLGLGWSLLRALQAYGPTELKRLDRAGLDLLVLAYTLGLTLVTGLLLGLAPALTASRRALNDAMRDGGRGASPSRRANRLREAFTVIEVALALVLLAGAGLLLKSFSRLMAVDPGFRAEHVLTANLSLPGDRYEDQRGVQFFAELGRRVRSLPGVVNASNITFLPFRGMGSGTYYFRADRPRPAPGQEEVTDVRMVQPGYFETMNIPLRHGRTFSEAENDPKGPLRFVISESLARAMYPGGEDPVGRQLIVQMGRENPPGEIIGVVRDIKHGGLDAQVRPMVYYPQSHLFFNFGTLVVQTSAEPMALAKAVTGVIHEMDPDLAVAEVGTMQRWIDESVARPKFQMRLLAGFAALALVLALMGIYGVMSYAVEQRTHEIGVRMALGAQRGDVSLMILARGARMAAIGLAVGIAGALVLGKYLETLLFEVKPADPVTLALVAGLLLAVALGACYVPARRASSVDPLSSLRYE